MQTIFFKGIDKRPFKEYNATHKKNSYAFSLWKGINVYGG